MNIAGRRSAAVTATTAALVILALLMIGLAGCTQPVPGQTGSQAERAGEGAKRPLQVGKLIKKRRIAPVMSVAHADWLTRPERDEEEQPDRVVQALKIPQGATVVDLGAGVGYFTLRLAKQVGPRGRVLAVDIQQGMLDRLARNLDGTSINNVESILASADNPGLPVGEVDLVLLVDVYHEFSHPEQMLAAMRKALKPNGRIALVEFRTEDPKVPIKILHKMSKKQIMKEFPPNGLKLVEQYDKLPWQHLMFFGRDELVKNEKK